MDLEIGIEFTPQSAALLKFLKELQQVLAALKIDNNKLSLGDLQQQIQDAGGDAEKMLPIFQLLANEATEFGENAADSMLDFSGVLGSAEKAIGDLIQELEGGDKIQLPEAELPDIPEAEFPKVETPELDENIFGSIEALEELKAEQLAVIAAMEKAGDTGSEEYAAIKEKVAATEEAIKRMKGETGDAIEEIKSKGSGENVFERMFNFEAIGKGEEFLDGIAEKGQEARQALNLLESSAAATGANLDTLKDSAAELFASKGTDTYAESLQLIAAANRAIGDTLKGADLTVFATGAAAVAKTMDADVNDVIKKGSSFVKAFGLDGKQAYDLIALGAQNANTPSDDLMDTLSEYSPLMKSAGFSGEEFLGTLTTGAKEGVFNLDKIGDAIKETQIRLKAGDIENAFKDLGDIPEGLQDKLNASLEKATSGELSIKDFILEATKATDEAGLTNAMKSKIQVAISGTPAEDIGEQIYSRIFGAKIDTAQIADNALLAGEQVKQSLGDVSILDKITSGADVAFENIAASIAPIAAPLGSILGTVGQLGPGLTLLEDKFAFFSKVGGGIKDLALKILASIVPALGAQTIATGTATTATVGLNTAMLANPAFLIVAGIAAVAGAFLLFGSSAKDAETAVADVNSALSDYEKNAKIEAATVKQSNSLRALADEYEVLKNKTDSEAQKRFAEVSEELANRVPSSVSAIEDLGDASQDMGKKFNISTKEVKALADENERLAKEAKADSLENLADQAAALADSYKEAKEKQTELREDRDKLLEKKEQGIDIEVGITGPSSVTEDLKDVRKELGEVSGEVDKAENGMRDFISRMTEGGKSTEEIAKMLGVSVQEVKRFTGESAKAKDGAKGVAGESKKVATAVDSAAKKAQELGNKFSEARKQASDFSSTAINALAQDLIDLEVAKKSGDAASIAAAEARLKVSQQAARDAVVAEKDFEKIFKRAEILAGKTKPEVAAKEVKDVINAATEVAASLESLDDQIALQRSTALAAELEKIRQEEEAEKESVAARARSLRDAQKDKTKIVQNAEQIKELEEGGKVQLAVEEKYRNKRLQAERDFYAKAIGEEAKIINEATAQQIAELEFAEGEISGSDEKALRERLELRLRRIALQQGTEIRAVVDGNEEYISAYVSLQQAISKATSATTEEEKTASEETVRIAREKLTQIEQSILESNAKVGLIDAKFAKQTAQAIEEIQREAYEEKIRLLDEELAAKERRNALEISLAKRLVEDIARISEEAGNAFIDTEESDATKAIERDAELRVITEEEKQDRLTEIQERAEAKRLALQKQALGARLEAERQAAVADLELQRESLNKKLKIAEENGQTEEAKNIQKELAIIGEQIDEKGDIILNLSGELQAGVTEIFSNLFSGDTDKIKEPFRQVFQVLSGALTKLASAKVTQILLDSILPGLGIGGLIAAIGGKAVTESLLNSIMQPILQSLLSFPTGGAMVFDSPTLLQVGDGARLGGINREYIFRDDQLRETIRETVRVSDGKSDALLGGILHEMKKIPAKFVITQQQLYDAVTREQYNRK